MDFPWRKWFKVWNFAVELHRGDNEAIEVFKEKGCLQLGCVRVAELSAKIMECGLGDFVVCLSDTL